MDVAIGYAAGPEGSSPNGRVEDGAPVGMAFAPLTQDEQQQLGLDSSVKGVVVAQVTPGSRAEESGVQSGDVIVRVGNEVGDIAGRGGGQNPRRGT